MKTTLKAAMLCAALAAGGAQAGDSAKGCASDAAMRGMRELRTRDLGASCRMELMSSIMEEMVRHQLVLSEREPR